MDSSNIRKTIEGYRIKKKNNKHKRKHFRSDLTPIPSRILFSTSNIFCQLEDHTTFFGSSITLITVISSYKHSLSKLLVTPNKILYVQSSFICVSSNHCWFYVVPPAQNWSSYLSSIYFFSLHHFFGHLYSDIRLTCPYHWSALFSKPLMTKQINTILL